MATMARGSAGAALRPSFHLWMTLLMAFFVFAGFGMTYLIPLAMGTLPHAPPVVHLHGVIFFAWTVLLVTQAVLVNVKNVKLHRSLGTFGIAWAAITAFMGLLITIISIGDQSGWDANSTGLLYLSFVAPPSFAVLFAMAIRAVRKPQVHRNLILMAMISILMPGINRFYMMSLGLGSVPFYTTYLTMDAMIAAILWHERRVTGGVSRAAWIGMAIIVVPQFIMPLVISAQWFTDLMLWFGALVYYR
jgi:uncharacterized membrane protein